MPLTASLRLLPVLALCLVLPASVAVQAQAVAQSAAETEIRSRISQMPGQPSAYLDLAKLYIEQGRFQEASQMIANALALTRRQIPASFQAPRAAPESHPNAVRVGGDVMAPRKIVDVTPEYPALARAAGVQGVVILEVVLGTDGRVADAKVLRSIQMLDQAAIDAVSQWEYTPTLLNGVATEVIMTVTVNFTNGDR
jgi:protein TonB